MQRWRWFLVVMVLVMALPSGAAVVAAEPSLDLAPWRGPCVTPVVASGTGFLPGQVLKLAVQPENGATTDVRALASATADAVGNFTTTINFGTLYPGCAAGAYRLNARDAADALLAYAIYTIESAPVQGPTLAIDPATGPCATPDPLAVARGTAFPPGVAVLLDVRLGANPPTTFPAGVIATDGSFTAPIRLSGCGPTTPSGTAITVVAYTSDALLATATFTVAGSTDDRLCFPETGRCVSGRFLARWRASGGLPINGLPLTDEFVTTLEDNRSYLVQYFERTRLEYHSEVAAPYDVQFGQLGRRILATVPNAPVAPVAQREGTAFYPETGHNVVADFVAYWAANGGLPQFGYPLTEEFDQVLEDGKTYRVQYFERARFERHPENPDPYKLQLGQFGRRVCGAACTSVPIPSASPAPSPTPSTSPSPSASPAP